MGKKKTTGRRAYVGIESGLTQAKINHYVSCDKRLLHSTRTAVEQVVRKIIKSMNKQSLVFARLYERKFDGGSVYDDLKIGAPDEFDIDILLKIPEVVQPVLVEDGVAGFAQLRLKNFQRLAQLDKEVYEIMREFVDNDNYLLSNKMKSSFMQSIFDKTMFNQFPDGVLKITRNMACKISRVQHQGPALTVTLDGPHLDHVAIDLVPSILLGRDFWPKSPCRQNPYSSSKLQEFFLSPSTPKSDHAHKERFWRLSFHIQERQILFNRYWLKPTIRVLKGIRDHFGHSIRSYAIKTVFLWELNRDNPDLDAKTPELWANSPLSYVVVYMLERYLQYLKDRKLPDFWNSGLNLFCHLTEEQFKQYCADVDRMLLNIKQNPSPEVILKYLK